MKKIGIRELRQHASVYLRLVEAGETLEVTDRGRPVAHIVPLPETPMERFRREHRTRPATGDLLKIKPLEPKPGMPSLSELLRIDREDER